LTDQKGLDLINRVIEQICDEHTQFVVIGTGETRYENLFKHFQWKYPDRVSANIFFSEQRAHRLYAAADAMLVPSRFEPCGLTQLIALRYGTLPIVRETGGLKDTVVPYNEFENYGNGFSFTNYDSYDMLNVINYAKTVYFTRNEEWQDIVKRAMNSDFSWNSSANQYAGMYKWLSDC
ncbi:MAG: glycosyltransferase, partial [Oscillospiraceae bacterium]|nr:glycosyltransferase [Oscillospiraceae bacterium]